MIPASNSSEALTESEKVIKIEKITMTALYFVCFIIHAVLTLFAGMFNLTPDEYCVTAVAALANGNDWSATVSTAGYYGYFQSIFYIPVYWIFSDPIIQYKAMIMVNGLLVSFIPIIVYWLSRRIAKTDNRTSIIFAVLCGLYPSYVTLTKFTWNETLCDLLPWVFMLLMCLSLRTEAVWKKHTFSALAGLALAAAYATHGRMLALAAAGVVLVIVAFFIMKKRIFCFSSFFGAIAIGFIGDSFIKKFLQNTLWLTGQTDKTPSNTIEKMIEKILGFDMETISNFFKVLFGHIFYFLGSTWGFGAICIVAITTALFIYFKRKAKKQEQEISDEIAIFALFAFLSMGAIITVSSIFKTFSTLLESRMDTVLYGRYAEAFFPIAIFITLVLMSKALISLKQYFASLVTGTFLCMLFIIFSKPLALGCDRIVAAMVLGLSPLRYGEGIKTILDSGSFTKIIITVIVVLLAFVFLKAFKKDETLIVPVVMVGLFVYSGAFCFSNYNVPQAQTSYNNGMKIFDATEGISSASDEFENLVVMNLVKERYVKLQFLRPEFTVYPVKNTNELNKLDFEPSFIVSNNTDNLEFWYDGIYRISRITDTHPVYVYSDAAKEWAVENGYTLSKNGVLEFIGTDILFTAGVVEEGGNMCIPKKQLVYTHYMTLQPNTYTITAEGSGIGTSKIALVADKGETDLSFEIIEQSEDKVVLTFTADKKYENCRLKFTNTNEEDIYFSSLLFEKSDSNLDLNTESNDNDYLPENDE